MDSCVNHDDYWGIGLMPHYEYRFYLQSIGSYFFTQIGFGASYFDFWTDQPWDWAKHTSRFYPAIDAKVGCDFRLCKGLYFSLSAGILYHFMPKQRYVDEWGPPTPGLNVQAGLRFGRER